MQISATYTSTSTKVLEIGTLSGITLLGNIQGTARSYGNPSSTTVYPSQININSSTGVLTAYTGTTSQGIIGTIVFPFSTTATTRGNVEQTRGTIEEPQVSGENKTITDEQPLDEKIDIKESGDAR